MSGELRTIAEGVLAFGALVAGSAFIALIASIRSPFGRLMALGWVYIGMSIVVMGGALVAVNGLSDSGDSTALLIAAVPLLVLAAVSFGLVRGASKAFRAAAAARDIGE